MKKNSFKYREDQSSDSFEDEIDYDTGTARAELKPTPATKAYFQMLAWAEKRRGFPFLRSAVKKQFKAFAIARENNYKPDDLQNRWIEFECDKFWKVKGFDWMDVVMSFNKKGK